MEFSSRTQTLSKVLIKHRYRNIQNLIIITIIVYTDTFEVLKMDQCTKIV